MPHRLVPAPRPATASLDKPLVIATWWIITRSMVVHAVGLALVICLTTSQHPHQRTTSYNLILHWVPIWFWFGALAIPALVWLLTTGWVCVVSGLWIAVWFFAFAWSFLIAWLALPEPSTTPTGAITYGFLGWAWMCVSYVVWKDTEHIREERARLDELDVALHVLGLRGEQNPE